MFRRGLFKRYEHPWFRRRIPAIHAFEIVIFDGQFAKERLAKWYRREKDDSRGVCADHAQRSASIESADWWWYDTIGL